MRKLLLLVVLVCPLMAEASFKAYQQVDAKAEVVTSAASHYVTVRVHLRNIGGIATACTVEAGGQKRITGISIGGEAEVEFAALGTYKGITVRCLVN